MYKKCEYAIGPLEVCLNICIYHYVTMYMYWYIHRVYQRHMYVYIHIRKSVYIPVHVNSIA